MILGTSIETSESHSFTTNNWFVFVGTEESEGIQIHNYVLEKETTLSHEYDQYLNHFVLSDAWMEEQLQELVFAENNGEVEGKHSYIVLTSFEEQLRMLEDWLVNPRIDKGDCITIASIECS